MTLLTPEQQRVEAELRELVGHAAFALTAEGRGVLTAGEATVVVDVPPHARHVVCSTGLGSLPSDPAARQSVVMAALQYNMFLAEGDGAAVAAHPNGDGSLYLCYRLPLHSLDGTVLANVIANLAARAGPLAQRLWGLEATAARAGAAAEVPAPALSSQFMNLRA